MTARHPHRHLIWALIVVTTLVVGFAPVARAGEIVKPEPGSTWQYHLSGPLDLGVDAEVFDIDGFETTATQVATLHDNERYAICYISAGAWERWRPDASDFPKRLLGRTNGWPGERWLDIRRLQVLKPIFRQRLDMCDAKGFDAVEFDNVDGFRNRSGWPLRGKDQLRFNRFLAGAAHHRGIAAGLKNDLSQIDILVDDFDFAVNEQCWQYNECGRLNPFTQADKAVFNVEYHLQRSEILQRVSRARLRCYPQAPVTGTLDPRLLAAGAADPYHRLVNTEEAARRWAEVWARAWPAKDVESIAALYADNTRYLSYPFREPDEGIAGARDYLTRTLNEEDNIECWFGEPVAGTDRAAVEWWASWTEDGMDITLAGTSLLRFDDEGLVVDHRDYWNQYDGRRPPYPRW